MLNCVRIQKAKADPGLVVGGGANPFGGGAPTQYIHTFSEESHEI